MRLFFSIMATSALLLTACSEQGTETSEPSADAQSKWNVKDVDAATAQKLLAENKELRVLDIRTPQEYAEGHIAGALNVDFKAANFAGELAKLDKDQAYILHCRSGRRSTKALPILKDNHFSTIYHLNNGFNDWKDSGMLTAP